MSQSIFGYINNGIRFCTQRWTDRYGQVHQRKVKCHRFDQWREKDVTEKFNLTDEIKFKIGAALNKYFALRTKWEIV